MNVIVIEHDKLCSQAKLVQAKGCRECQLIRTVRRETADEIKDRIVDYASSLSSTRHRETALTCASPATTGGLR